jgi:hypothetical protein
VRENYVIRVTLGRWRALFFALMGSSTFFNSDVERVEKMRVRAGLDLVLRKKVLVKFKKFKHCCDISHVILLHCSTLADK